MADVQQATRCWYCGVELKPRSSGRRGEYDPHERTVDHVVPRSRGGSNRPENRVDACRLCNSRKGAQTVEEFRSMLEAECVYRAAAETLTRATDAHDDEPAFVRRTLEWLQDNRAVVVFHGEQKVGHG